MRVMVFFDLPTLTSMDKREYRQFRKFLINRGFVMVQQSVYSKLALNQTAAKNIVASVKRNSPVEGVVQMLVVTEKQYGKMEYVIGEKQSNVIDSDERLVIL